MKKYILHFLGIGIFVYILSKIEFGKVVEIFRQCNGAFLVFAVMFGFLEIVMKGLRWKMILKALGVSVSWLEAVKIYWIGIFVGSFTPGKVGDFSKAAFVKDKENSSIFKAIVSIFFDRLIDVCTLGLCSMIAVFFIHKFKTHVIVLAVLIALGFVFLGLLLHKKSPVRFLLGKFLQKIAPAVHTDFEKFSLNKVISEIKNIKIGYILKVGVVVVIGWASYFIEWFFLSRSLSINIPFLFVMSTVAIAALVAIIPISISGIGTRDATIIFMFSQFALPKETALAFSISLFVISMSLNCVGLIPYLSEVKKA